MTKKVLVPYPIFMILSLLFSLQTSVWAAPPPNLLAPPKASKVLKHAKKDLTGNVPYFDLPVTYNSKVKSWIRFFQGNGRRGYKKWLERSGRYIPKIVPMLKAKGLPEDLVYLAMIESGFSPYAHSTASAVGYWQFIKPTATRYGLKVNWWLDERKDIVKSTLAAATYLNDLYGMFNSWYLAASAYNMGEGRTKRLIKKYKTKNYWVLSKKKGFPRETADYIPKLLAAMLIAKAPKMYGFRSINLKRPRNYVYFEAPGGTDLENLAYYVGANKKQLKRLNPALTRGFIPQFVKKHRIRIPHETLAKAHDYAKANL